jgi:hypothetical protein
MPYEHFHCDPVNGSNMNGGATASSNSTGVEPGNPVSYANGGWNQGTGVYTVPSGNPVNDGVAVGDFASVFADGATTPVFVGKVTARDATTITVSLTQRIGAAPATASPGMSIKVGGKWKGPNGTSGFPFVTLSAIALKTLLSTSTNTLRINLKNNGTYSVTAGMTISSGLANQVEFRGYSSTPGDGGKATIDGGSNAITIVTSSSFIDVVDIIVSNASAGFSFNSAGAYVWRCAASGMTNSGFASNQPMVMEECEAYLCNSSNTANQGGFQYTGFIDRRLNLHPLYQSRQRGRQLQRILYLFVGSDRLHWLYLRQQWRQGIPNRYRNAAPRKLRRL